MATTTPSVDGAESWAVEGADVQVRRLLHESLAPFDPSGTAQEWHSRGDDIRELALQQLFLKGFEPSMLESSVNVVVARHDLRPDPSYRVRPLRFEAFPGYWVPALLYLPEDAESASCAAVLNAGGHHDAGVAAEYNQIRCANLARRRVVALSFEFIGMGELSADSDFVPGQGASLHNNLAALELVGIGAAAPMFITMRRALDVLLSEPTVDPTRVAMTGLSGGGWQTIVLAALDTRIGMCVPVAGYTSLAARVDVCDDVGDLEQVPADLGTVVDYQTMTALLAPRPTLLVLNDQDDCCFRTDRTKPVIYDAVRPVFQSFGADDRFSFHGNADPGTHNYGQDNRQRFYAFLAEHFGVESVGGELHRREELLTPAQTRVGLPADQLTLHDVAVARARELRTQRRGSNSHDVVERIRRVLRLADDTDGVAEDDDTDGATAAPSWAGAEPLRVGRWSLPVHGSRRADVIDRIILEIDDAGAALERPYDAAAGARLGVDLLGLGSMAVCASLQPLIAATGHRLLGIQVGQTLMTARALASRGATVGLVARGAAASVVAMLAVTIDGGRCIERLTTSDRRLGSFEDLIHRGVRLHELPSLFCADLLSVVDLADLERLLDAVPWDRGDEYVPSELPK